MTGNNLNSSENGVARPYVAGLLTGLCLSIGGVYIWQMRWFGSFLLPWAAITLLASIYIIAMAIRRTRVQRTFLSGAAVTVAIAPAATAVFGIAIGALALTGFNPGIDLTPPGCALLKVTGASYRSRTNRIVIHLSDGSSYWAVSQIEYLSWKDHHIGAFEQGSDVIVCPPKSGSVWYIRNNIVGELGEDFHRF
jgi:hypothetical protein